MHGAPEPGAPAPATEHSPRILFLTAFTIDFSRFEVHLSCSVGVLRRDSISAHSWYGSRSNLDQGMLQLKWPFRGVAFTHIGGQNQRPTAGIMGPQGGINGAGFRFTPIVGALRLVGGQDQHPAMEIRGFQREDVSAKIAKNWC